jgi:hypothetical protein
MLGCDHYAEKNRQIAKLICIYEAKYHVEVKGNNFKCAYFQL